MNKLLSGVQSVVLFLEGKKTVIGSIGLALLAFLQGRNLIAPDATTLILSILSALGFSVVGVASTKSYQDKLGARK